MKVAEPETGTWLSTEDERAENWKRYVVSSVFSVKSRCRLPRRD